MTQTLEVLHRLSSSLKSSAYVLLALAVLALMPGRIAGQAATTSATIVGTVTDQAGAVIPGATVTVVNTGTGESRKVTTGADGNYAVNALPPGTYSITVTMTAFKTFKVPSLFLAAGDSPRVNAKLSVGEATQTVSVEATTPLLQSESATMQSSVNQVTVQDLPLNGRNFVQLVQMVPGVNEGPPNSLTNGQKPDDKRQTASFSANGQSEVLNNYMIDGMDNNEGLIGSVGVRNSVDAISQISVETSVYPADDGRTGGAAVNIITKSGTNSFHGTLYEYFRNDIFNTYPYQFGAHNAKQEWRQNQFGGSVGGPIKHNRFFFFGDYEGFRLVTGANPQVSIVPTLFEEQNPGSFTDQPAGVLASGDYGSGGVISSGSLDSSALDYLQLYPAPNLGNIGGTGTTPLQGKYVGVAVNTQFSNVYDIRLDYQANPNNQFFGRYSYNNVKTWNPGTFPVKNVAGVSIEPFGGGFSPSNDHNVDLSYTHIFTPSLLTQLQLGYLRVVNSTYPAFFGDGNSVGPNVNSAYGMPGVNISGITSGLAHMGFTNGYQFVGGGAFVPLTDNSQGYQVMLTVNYTRGAHNFKFGGGGIRRHYLSIQSSAQLPQYTFKDLGLMEQGEFLLVNRALVTTNPYYRRWEWSAYAQDDWHVTSNTTLNLGVRYDIYTPFTEIHDNISTWNPVTESIMVAGQNGVSATAGIRTFYGAIAPRIGVSTTLGHGTVIHAGFGMAYYPDQITSNATPKNPPILATYGPYSTASAASLGYGNYAYLHEGAPTLGSSLFQNINPADPVGAIRAATDPNFQPGEDLQFVMNIQKDFGGNVLTMGYAGVLERHAPQSFTDLNEPQPYNPTIPGHGIGSAYAQSLRPYYSKYPGLTNVGWYASEGAGSVHEAEISFARRLRNGLSYNVNYTYMRNLDNWTGMSDQGNPGWGMLVAISHTYDYGNSDLDLRNRAAAVVDYTLPFAATATGMRAEAAKGWEINLIGADDAGQPVTIINSTSLSGSNQTQNADRPNRLPGSPYSSNKGVNQYLSKSDYASQTPGTLGNSARNSAYGPSFRHIDMSVIKNFPIREGTQLEFRAEGFNMTNTASFGVPVNTLQVPNFGQITSMSPAYNPRVLQFALKLMF